MMQRLQRTKLPEVDTITFAQVQQKKVGGQVPKSERLGNDDDDSHVKGRCDC